MTLRASWLIGTTVVDGQGQRLGKVSDLLLENRDPASLCYALVDVEHPAGRPGRTVAVPWSVLRPAGKRRELVLGVSREALRQLRRVERS